MMNRRTTALLAAAFLWGTHAQAQMTERPPFSDAVRVGDILYLSGQIGIVPQEGRLAPGGMAEEARQTLDNIGEILRTNGLGFDDVFKCTVMLTDMSRWAEFNQVYAGYFNPERLPARSALGVNALALGAQTEIECLARFPGSGSLARSVSSERIPPLGPYSLAVIAGNLVFVSGVIPFNPETRAFASSDFTSQMAQALENLDRSLQAAGVARSQVVKTTVFLRNASDMAAMNEAYAAYFGDVRPARTTVPGIDWGREDLLVEIDAVAVAPVQAGME